MWLVRAVLLHFVQLGDLDDGQRVFLGVDHLGLQRGIDFAELQAGRRGAQALEHGDGQRAHRHADLEAVHVGGGLHRRLAAGGLAKAVVPHLLEGVEAALRDGGAHVRAQRAVHGVPDLVVVLEGEAHGVDRRHRHQRGDDQRRRREEIDAARAHLRQHVGVAAQLVVGEDLDVHPAVAFLEDAFGRFLGADVQRMGDGQVVAVLQRVVGGARDHRETAGQGQGGNGAQAAQGTAAGHQFHGCLHNRGYDVF